MSKISTYSLADEPLQLSDRLIGTEAPRPNPSPTPLATKNFSLGELLQLFSANFPAATLQAVLNAGNIATQNITLTGTINTTVVKPTNIEDILGSQGTNFQFLSKATSGINWVNLPVDNLQAVLNAGNTATQNINLTGNITSTRIIPGNIQDYTTSIGTTGQVLTKSTSGIVWSNLPASTTPGLNDVLLVGNTSLQNANIGELGLWDSANSNYISIGTTDQGVTFNVPSVGEIFVAQNDVISFGNGGLASITNNLLTASRVYQLPNASGTIALTSNIPSAITLTTTGTSGPSTLIGSVLNIPIYAGGSTYTFTSPLVDTAGVITINQSNTTTNGYLSSTDWNTFNGKQNTITLTTTGSGAATFISNVLNIPTPPTAAFTSLTTTGSSGSSTLIGGVLNVPTYTLAGLGGVPTNRNLTINGTTYDLSADRTWNVGTVTSVSATGPLTSTGGATPTISTSMATNKLIGRSTAGTGVMEEITVGSGLSLSGGTLSASSLAGSILHGTASGTDTYTVTITGATTYSDGDAYLIRFTNGNTTSATLNINGFGAVQLYRNNDGPVIGGDILANGEMLCIYNSTSNIFQCIGVAPNTLLAYVTNDEAVTITRGQPVYVSGGVGDRIKVKLAYNTTDSTSAQTIGVVSTASIAANQKGIIIVQGQLDNLNLFPTSTWADGDYIYLGATPGSITNVKPVAPNHLVYLGYVTTASNGSAGRMYVKVQNGYELQELHNVYINPATLANNDLIQYNSSTSLWVNRSLSAAGIQATLSGTGIVKSTAGTISYINGTTAQYVRGDGSLATFPTIPGGTVTSVAALTLGTSGTDLSSTVVNSTTTPVITLNVPTASATNRGALSSADWTTFNNKQPAIGYTPLSSANNGLSLSGTIAQLGGTLLQSTTIDGGSSSAYNLTFTNGNFIISNGAGGGGLRGNIILSNNRSIYWGSASGNSISADSVSGGITYYAPPSTGKHFFYSSVRFSDYGSGTKTGTATYNLSVNSTGDIIETAIPPTIPTLTSGSVVFSNGTTLAQDNANFFWDDTNNRLGIGTASPGVRFVNSGAALSSGPTLGSGTVGSQALLSNNGLYGMYSGVSSNGDVWHQVQRNDGNTAFYNLALQPSGGNLYLGTNAPIYATPSKFQIFFNGAIEYGINFKTDAAAAIPLSFIANTGTQVGYIIYDTTGTAYTTISDYRLKEDLNPINGLDLISKINVYDYKWKEQDKRSYGVLAHELQEIIPQAVFGQKDGAGMQSVDYSLLVPILIDAIKEQQKQIDELKSRFI